MEKKVINLFTVGNFQKSHGYERVMKGLKQYNEEEHEVEFLFHMVGEGTELNYYKKLVQKLGLTDSIFFYGKLTGERLEEVYKKADIGLGIFGAYKRKLYLSSALKIREYLLHGLPIVSGCREDIFIGKDVPFFIQFNNDSSVIDMDKIVHFYENLEQYGTKETLKETIVDFCRKNADMNITMKPVLEYLKE